MRQALSLSNRVMEVLPPAISPSWKRYLSSSSLNPLLGLPETRCPARRTHVDPAQGLLGVLMGMKPWAGSTLVEGSATPGQTTLQAIQALSSLLSRPQLQPHAIAGLVLFTGLELLVVIEDQTGSGRG